MEGAAASCATGPGPALGAATVVALVGSEGETWCARPAAVEGWGLCSSRAAASRLAALAPGRYTAGIHEWMQCNAVHWGQVQAVIEEAGACASASEVSAAGTRHQHQVHACGGVSH